MGPGVLRGGKTEKNRKSKKWKMKNEKKGAPHSYPQLRELRSLSFTIKH